MVNENILGAKIMNRLLVLTTCCILLVAFSGCNELGQPDANRSDLTLHTDNTFPASMVGIWETEPVRITGRYWGIKFEPDGSVRKIIHNVAGPVTLAEGGVFFEGADPNQEYALFVIEECPVKYDSETGMLQVEIILESFLIQKGTDTLEGSSLTRFSGPISNDGISWTAEKRTYAKLEGATSPTDEFIDTHPDTVVFYKLEIPKQ